MRALILASATFVTTLLAFSNPAQARLSSQGEADFLALMNVPANYTVSGTVCEEVARLRLIEQYPEDRYEVITGIVYRNEHRVLGELDVVILDKENRNEAVFVAEVKCRRSMSSAHNHAVSQLNRFANALDNGDIHRIHLLGDFNDTYLPNQFDEDDMLYWTIAQDGCESHGFDMCIGLDLDEARELGDMLASYHSAH